MADESYAEALLVLEQGLSSYQSQDPITENSKGMLLLAISSLLNERFGGEVFEAVSFLTSVARIVLETTAFFFFFFDRGNVDEAKHALLLIQDLSNSSLGVRGKLSHHIVPFFN